MFDCLCLFSGRNYDLLICVFACVCACTNMFVWYVHVRGPSCVCVMFTCMNVYLGERRYISREYSHYNTYMYAL